MLTTAITLGLISAFALLLIVYKMIGWEKMKQHDILIDIAVTVGLGFLFAGTLMGMLTAVIGGLIVSIILLIAKARRKPKRPVKLYVFRNGRRVN